MMPSQSFIQQLEKEHVFLSETQQHQFARYAELLVEWNQKMNLTAIIDYEEVLWKHFVDSALLIRSEIFKNQNFSVETRFLDIGTGVGFPGMVLAILCPECSFTLVDSLQKRIDFLQTVKQELQLKNVELFHGRAENFGKRQEFRNQFDFVVSRAVAELPVLLEFCIPFVKVGGYFISYKGIKQEQEILISDNAFNKLTCKLEKTEQYDLNGETRFLLFIRNLELTDSRYPRKEGKPKKQPL